MIKEKKMGLNKFITVISNFLDIHKDKEESKKKALKKLLKKLKKRVSKLEHKIKKSDGNKEKEMLKEELSLVCLHLKKGQAILEKKYES
jgi:regulator of PEP synthase PpsR (kinase-PPPase family)